MSNFKSRNCCSKSLTLPFHYIQFEPNFKAKSLISTFQLVMKLITDINIDSHEAWTGALCYCSSMLKFPPPPDTFLMINTPFT